MRARMAAEGHAWHPFHWDIEFPEVFERDNPGFDAVLGNPPYAGKNTYAKGNAPGFPEWLQAIHPGAHGNADLSAHFFRRGYALLREGGCLGFVATNTIAQGDTRESGLAVLLREGATISGAVRRIRWPGDAAVVVCVVQLVRGPSPVAPRLDGREVSRISAFLIEGTRDESPQRLPRSEGLAYQGSILLGMGFTFDDDTNDPAANPVSEMRRLTAPEHPQGAHNAARIKPYLDWWRFLRGRPELLSAVAGLPQVLTISRVTPQFSFAFLPSGMVYSEQLVVFAVHKRAGFALLQSRVHEVWARFFSSSMKDDMRYAPSDCLETFPLLPDDALADPALAKTGQTFHDARAARMVAANEGLTATHNRLDDPEERDSAVLRLRTLHDEMDRAVLRAYGWPHPMPECVHEREWPGDEDDPPGPWRRRWPEADRARLLEFLWTLNEAEVATGGTAQAAPARRGRRRRVTASAPLLEPS